MFYNTHYFNMFASSRLRKNQIKVLDADDGNPTFSYSSKASILHNFFKTSSAPPSMRMTT
jgi:hypothetical protein